MLNALRLKDGFTPQLFQERSGIPLGLIRGAMQQAEAAGLLDWDIRRIVPTPRGWRYLNDLMQRFLPESLHDDHEGAAKNTTPLLPIHRKT